MMIDLIIINHYMVIITMVDFIDFYASNLEVVGEYPITKISVGNSFFSKVKLLFQKITKQLRATSGVLLANPDITTLWNIRKEMLEIILSFFGNFAPSNINDHDANLKKELDLTLQCLQNNPKSYGAWHHRCWSMLKMKNPNWDNELALCNKYLSLDERNFHCWDYRRFVVKHNANISAHDELNYSYDKIEEKIENYSAWHYRSKLLPLTDPCNAG